MAARSASVLACAVLVLSSGAAFAQVGNNQITILQQGDGNRLTVNQGAATGSRVGGLTLSSGASGSGQLVLDSGRQFQQRVNVNDPLVPVVSSAQVLVPSFNRDNPTPAIQQGVGNRAEVTVQGTGGFVGLLQDNSRGLLPNISNISLDGNGTALVGQEGEGNRADLSVSGTDAYGAILQNGSRNNVGLAVSGTGARGTISQVGSDNSSSLAVTSASGSDVTYVLQGNGIQSFNPLEGVDVSTNAASVTITQTAFGGGAQ